MAKIIFDSEKEFEDFVCTRIDDDKACPVSGEQVDLFWRQLNLGTYGIADIVKAEVCLGSVVITVLELKKEIINKDAIIQAVRYAEGIKHFISKYYPKYKDITVYSELAAPSLRMDQDTVYLINAIENLTVYTIFCDLDNGFSTEVHSGGFVKIKPHFSHLREQAIEVKKCSIDSFRCYRDFENSKVTPIRKI